MLQSLRSSSIQAIEAAAYGQGFTGFAYALFVIRLAEQYGISCTDAETFIQDQDQFARELAQQETQAWAERNYEK